MSLPTMPLVPRYLLRQFAPLFGACLALFLGVLLMNQFLRLFTLAMMKGIPVWWILSCFARLLPSFATLAVPMAFLVAVMLTLGHLSSTGELIALRAAGFSFREITRPFFWAALALSVLLLLVNHKTGPEGFRSFRKAVETASSKMARLDLRPRSFTVIGPWRLYARDYAESTGRLEGVYLVKPGDRSAVRVSAEHGSLVLDPGRGISLELLDGELQLPNDEPSKFTSGRFDRYRVHIPLSGGQAAARDLDIQELNTARLRERSADDKTPPDRRREYRVEAALRSASAFSPLVFFWIAAPLGLGLKRSARGGDFAASLGVLFVFYGLLVVGVSAGRRHDLLAPLAPWLADAAGLCAGAWLSRRAARL
ncbi:MAG: LptF/LptG family permease [Elusimicrobiota bacterium]|nr:LptF/LptG family permease [Elusimicrobiota bacterium]